MGGRETRGVKDLLRILKNGVPETWTVGGQTKGTDKTGELRKFRTEVTWEESLPKRPTGEVYVGRS